MFKLKERYAILLYDKTSYLEDVNECRRVLSAKKARQSEGLPSTKDAPVQHLKRAVLQGG